MTDHEHRPDYAYYHHPRITPKKLTCIHCGKPIYCSNDHLSWLLFLPVLPAMFVFNSRNPIAMFLSIIAVGLLIPLLQRRIFPKLHFEIDTEALREDLSHYGQNE